MATSAGQTPAAPQRFLLERPPVLLDPGALRVLDAETLRALRAVPVAVTERAMRVAAATSTPDQLARQLRIRTGLSVAVFPASPDEIEAALAAALEPETAAHTLSHQADAWRDALGLGAAETESQLEAFSLATGRPVLDLARWRHDPALVPLLDTAFARAQQAAPLQILGRTLLVVTSNPIWQPIAATVIADTGLTVQVALAQDRPLSRLVEELYGKGPVRLVPRRSAEDSSHARSGWWPSLRTRGAGAARSPGARAAKPVSLRGLTPAPETTALLPRRLAERLRCVVVRANAEAVHVAIPPDAAPETLDLLTAVLGRGVRPLTATEEEIAAARRRAYRSVHAAITETLRPPIGVYLRHSGQVTEAQLAEALAEQSATGERLGRILVRRGVLSEDALREALALRHDLPHLRLRGVLPDPASVRLLPEDLAREHTVLALRRQDPVLHVAVADPADPTVHAIAEQVAGLRVRPVLATEEDIRASVPLLYHIEARQLPARVQRLVEWLVETGKVSRERAIALRVYLAAENRGVDESLIEAGVGDAEEVASLLAAFTGTMRMRLWPAERFVPDTAEDAGFRRLMVDPVEPDAARRLPAALLDEAVALPVTMEGGRPLVAVADPFDTEAADQLREACGGSYDMVISTREEIHAALRRTIGRRTLGDHLLAAGMISAEELARGLEVARRSNVRLGKALLSLGYITQEQLARGLAEQFEMPRIDLDPEAVNPEVARLIPPELAQERGVLPLAVTEQVALVATTDPLDNRTVEEIAQRLGRAVRTVLTTERQMEAALGALYRVENVERASLGLLARAPDDSAAKVWTKAQLAWITVIGAAVLLGLVLAPILTLTVLVTGMTGFYAVFSGYKLYLIYRALGGTFEEDVTPEELAALDERELPVYTVLVPMYREAGVLPILIDALGRMEYPRTKLDVILLLEEDDEETQAAVRATRLPEGFRALVVPFRRPKTKPKACNYGLLHARGEFLVIYDAEDVPEPDQLKKAVAVFRRYDGHLACIQSKLNYFNRDQNLLTRWFTTEYSNWFDLLLPGLQHIGAPIPLGGTSNHFRTAILRELDGWDPFNTTEDADLGLRIFKRGYRTVVMNSTTYEEANSRLRNWIRQRSRWVKGYMQTWLVHMRHPVRLVRQLGLLPFLSFQLVIAGTFCSFLINPVLWGLTALWFISHWHVIEQVFPAPVFYLGTVSLYVGNLAFVYINVLGALRRRYYTLVPYALFTPIYWAMMSIAAWQAFYELLFKPHYWQKTQHGLFKGRIRVQHARNRAA